MICIFFACSIRFGFFSIDNLKKKQERVDEKVLWLTINQANKNK